MVEMPELLSDKDIARCLRVSPEWVRQERFRRRHGKAHFLNIDPVLVGSKPRYLAKDFELVLAALVARKEHPAHGDFHP
jgi:hypothetical protein